MRSAPRPTEELAAGLSTDAGSFDAFYRSQVDGIYRALTLALDDPHLAREAVDEAMTRAYVRWNAIAHYDNPGGWVFRVGLNWATSRWRMLHRERPLAEDDREQPLAEPTTDAIAVRQALAHLPVNQRAVIVCRILLDLSTAQTATTLDIAEGTVKSRLARALTALRAELCKEPSR